MKLQWKKALSATVAVFAFAAAAVASFAGKEGAARSAGTIGSRGGIQDQSGLAEYYLSNFAGKSKKTRTTAGGIGLAVGAVALAGGIVMLGRDDEGDWLGLNEFFGATLAAGGGLACAAGIYSLAAPSPAERSYKRVRDITDPGQREAACAEALSSLAGKGRRARMIGGGLICAIGAAGVIASADEGSSGPLLMAACTGGLALYSFLVKSPAERTYRAYLERKGSRPTPDLILGFGPRGSFRAGLSLDF